MQKYNIVYILFLICAIHAFGQDPHFSQFNEQPSLINPALTGAVDPFRVSLGYKDQWKSVTNAYKTYGASFETRFKQKTWEQLDNFRTMTFKQRSTGRLAAGLSAYKDRAGDGNLSLTQLNLSIASFVPLNKNNFLSVGLQASVVQRKLDNTKLIFSNQYNGTGYDASMISGENFSSQNIIYPDFAGGLLWKYHKTEKKHVTGTKEKKAMLGVSVYHINKPTQKYLASSKDELNMKYVCYGKFLVPISNRFSFEPTCLMQLQGSVNEVLAGGLFKYYMSNSAKYTGISKQTCLSFGGYYRNMDAAIVNVMLELQDQYAIGFSYDVNTSQLKTASYSRGGMEITLRYSPPAAFLYQMKKK